MALLFSFFDAGHSLEDDQLSLGLLSHITQTKVKAKVIFKAIRDFGENNAPEKGQR